MKDPIVLGAHIRELSCLKTCLSFLAVAKELLLRFPLHQGLSGLVLLQVRFVRCAHPQTASQNLINLSRNAGRIEDLRPWDLWVLRHQGPSGQGSSGLKSSASRWVIWVCLDLSTG